jgi:hypothetical protein
MNHRVESKAKGIPLKELQVALHRGGKGKQISELFLDGAVRLAVEFAKEALVVVLALLLLVFFVAFFYLYCLPWMGVH